MALSEFPAPLEVGSGDDPPELRTPPPGPISKSVAMRLERVECPSFAERRRVRAALAAEAGPESADVPSRPRSSLRAAVAESRAAPRLPDTTPIVLASGRGSNLHDVDGNRYVDLAAGFGSILLGHGAASVTRAIDAQGDRLMQALGDVYSADVKLALLERIASLHPGVSPRVILGQSGSDAVTAAIKTAKLATGRPGIVAFEGGYHGLGYAPLAACGLRESYRAPFSDQLNPSITFAPYPRSTEDADRSLSAVEAALAGGQIGAVLVEPILGRGGCVVPPEGFLSGLCEVAHRHETLVIADEIWTGLGRSGAMVLTTNVSAPVDILCFGKGLGGGLPISACVAPDAIMQCWAAEAEVVHTSTHAGAPVLCAAAVAVLDTIRFKQLVVRSREVGARVLETIKRELAGSRGIVDVRGQGMMIGVELESAALGQRAVRGLLGKGYVALGGGVKGEVVTFTPPLVIAEELFVSVGGALREVLAG
jgi:4-aminobutyrate aminotransferase / (S)-3-amino-2-methylpropionate transaminase / 5-aminovalerate transaminase